jgi:hypothetical protein
LDALIQTLAALFDDIFGAVGEINQPIEQAMT